MDPKRQQFINNSLDTYINAQQLNINYLVNRLQNRLDTENILMSQKHYDESENTPMSLKLDKNYNKNNVETNNTPKLEEILVKIEKDYEDFELSSSITKDFEEDIKEEVAMKEISIKEEWTENDKGSHKLCPSEVFHCAHCSYETFHKRYLQSHVVVHQINRPFFHCDQCSLKFKTKRYLQRHFLFSHAPDCLSFECDQCDYKTKRKGDLTSHLLIHQKNLPTFDCTFCDVKFKRKPDLTRHILWIHREDFPVFDCDYCDYKSKRKSTLRRHVISQHFPVKVKVKRSTFNCAHCNFVTKKKSGLKYHMMVHKNN